MTKKEHSNERGYLIAVASILALGAAACSGPRDDGEDTAVSAEAVYGHSNGYACPTGQAQELYEIMEDARIVSRSPAFAECVLDVFEQSILLPNNTCGGTDKYVGPYLPCGMGPACAAWCDGSSSTKPSVPCACDPIVAETVEKQIARLMSATRSRNPVTHVCEAYPLPVTQCTDGWATAGTNTIHWNRLPTETLWATGFALHELTHTAGYGHGDCGYGSGYTGWNAATGLIGSCAIQVARRSDALCNFNSPSCAPDERRIVRRYGSATAGDCHCVGSPEPDDVESGDAFGGALAVGDFDNDGFEDLAVGAPGEDADAGAVFLFRGSTSGLHGWKRIDQSDLYVHDAHLGSFNLGSEAGDRFGAALTVGDFDADGFDDLAIGVPGEKLSSESACAGGDCGYVVILPGSAEGTLLVGQGLSQRGLGANETDDEFGFALAAGDLDGDQLDDLVVGVPFEVYYGKRSGVAMVFSGSTATPGVFVLPTTLLVQTAPYQNETGDQFGFALAIGNIHGSDSRPEIAIGAPGENNSQGYVFIAEYNGSTWSVPYGVNNFHESGPTSFGISVAIGNVVSNGYDDLVVGAPAENQFAGGVLVFAGVWSGQVSPQQHLHNGDAAPSDLFGKSVAVGNFAPSSSKQDIVVGIPNEAIGSSVEGALWRYAGTTAGPQSLGWSGQQHFYSVGTTDRFLPDQRRAAQLGQAVAVGYFNGAEFQIAAGAPTDEPDGQTQAGSVYVFDGAGNDIQRLDQVAVRYGDGWKD